MDTVSDRAALKPSPPAVASRGKVFKPQGEDGFDQCWYPVAMSSEVTGGQVKGCEFLDGKVVAYRTRAGDACVMSAYCRHLGADLSVGAVIDDELRCPFHFWRYDSSGACTKVPAGDTPPRTAQLLRYPTSESMGLVWAFNGEQPTYPVPSFETPEEELVFRTFEAANVLPVDPIVQLLNAFDLQHFHVVHGLDLKADSYTFNTHTVDANFSFTAPELGPIVQRRTIWGTTCVTMNGVQPEQPIHMAAGLCALPGNRTRMYVSLATPKGDGSARAEARITKALDDAQAYAARLIGEDWPIQKSISFRVGMLTASDRLLVQALRWAERFPRTHPGADHIRK